METKPCTYHTLTVTNCPLSNSHTVTVSSFWFQNALWFSSITDDKENNAAAKWSVYLYYRTCFDICFDSVSFEICKLYIFR